MSLTILGSQKIRIFWLEGLANKLNTGKKANIEENTREAEAGVWLKPGRWRMQ